MRDTACRNGTSERVCMRFVPMGSRSRLSLTASLAVLAIAAANPAFAQDISDTTGAATAPGTDTTATDTAVPPSGEAGAAPSSTQTEPEQSTEVVVTGSRIARPTLDSPIPVTSVSVAELTRTGGVVIGDALNDLPSLRSTYSQ